VSAWKRREWTANPADPTAVTTWKFRSRYLRIALIESWGVTAEVSFFRWNFWSHDAWWAVKLLNFLEAREADRMNEIEDGYINLRYYE
jgi:hypothetical protein